MIQTTTGTEFSVYTVWYDVKEPLTVAAGLLGLRVRNPPRHGCLSLLSVVCCQAEVSTSG
jgi:hypothetical protein